jgi:hypothetical protein
MVEREKRTAPPQRTVGQPPPTSTMTTSPSPGPRRGGAARRPPSLTGLAAKGRSPADTDDAHLSLTRSGAGAQPRRHQRRSRLPHHVRGEGRATTTSLTRPGGEGAQHVNGENFTSSSRHHQSPRQFTHLLLASLGYQALTSCDEKKIRWTFSVGSLMQI